MIQFFDCISTIGASRLTNKNLNNFLLALSMFSNMLWLNKKSKLLMK